MSVQYEWDIEECDADGEVLNHDHTAKLTIDDIKKLDATHQLVLVRDSYGDKSASDDGRSWAYVEDNKLPEYFIDACGNETTKVPQRFKDELARVV